MIEKDGSSWAMEILSDMKAIIKDQNQCMIAISKNARIQIVTLIIIFSILITVVFGGFIWYLNQYDFVSQEGDINQINTQVGGDVVNGAESTH